MFVAIDAILEKVRKLLVKSLSSSINFLKKKMPKAVVWRRKWYLITAYLWVFLYHCDY